MIKSLGRILEIRSLNKIYDDYKKANLSQIIRIPQVPPEVK
ncbi:MAG: hypothetical protein WA395_14740 [Nitrososphaeraceae archaeon]